MPPATEHIVWTTGGPRTPFNGLRPLAESIGETKDIASVLTHRLKLVLQQLDDDGIPPHYRRLCERYRNAIERLWAKQETESTVVCESLTDHENQIRMYELYRLAETQEVFELRNKVLVAKKLEMYARYCDYFPGRWTHIRDQMDELKTKEETSASEYCNSVVNELTLEHQACVDSMGITGILSSKHAALLEYEWHGRLSFAATRLGFGPGEAEFAISQCAAMNKETMTGFKDPASKFDFYGLGKRVDRDLELLPKLFDSSEEQTADAFREVLTDYRHKWVVKIGDSYAARGPIMAALRARISSKKISKELASMPREVSDVRMQKKLEYLCPPNALSKFKKSCLADRDTSRNEEY